MGYVKWSYDTLDRFCTDVFKAFGFSHEESREIDVYKRQDLYIVCLGVCQKIVKNLMKRVQCISCLLYTSRCV